MRILILSFLLLGCASTAKRSTVFYKTSTAAPATLTGDRCLQSGLVLDEKRKTITEYFSNCGVKITRDLREHELEQWLVKEPF